MSITRVAKLLLILLLVGCASSGTPIAKNNNVIHLPHYSFVAPTGQGWKIGSANKNNYPIHFTKPANSASYQMYFSINWVASESMKTWTAKQVADDYRRGELSDMQAKGIDTGVYDELKDVAMGEEIIGDKQFYTMSYVLVSDNVTQRSSLYLYFPRETDIEIFVIAIYTDAHRGKAPILRSNKPAFISVLESLRVNKETR